MALLSQMLKYVRALEQQSHRLLVLHDLPGPIGCDKPPKIGNFRPDIYAANAPTTMVIIGEAKTASDLETTHSRKQFFSYLRYLALYPGSTLLVGVPWPMRIRAAHLLLELQLEAGSLETKLVVVDDVQELT